VTELETARLLLREFRASDEDALYEYSHHEQHWRHMPIEPPTPENVHAQIWSILESRDDYPRNTYHLAAVDKTSHEFVGEASLHVYRPLRLGTIGWGIHHDRAGQGLATEIGHAILRFAFGKLELHRIQAMCNPDNHASRRVMAKLGMREEGIIRDNLLVRGAWWSSVGAAILATDRN
jgi:RimJ/RimL family protein N-acetyltransferase